MIPERSIAQHSKDVHTCTLAENRCRGWQQDREKGVCRMQMIASVKIDTLQSCLTQESDTTKSHAFKSKAGHNMRGQLRSDPRPKDKH